MIVRRMPQTVTFRIRGSDKPITVTGDEAKLLVDALGTQSPAVSAAVLVERARQPGEPSLLKVELKPGQDAAVVKALDARENLSPSLVELKRELQKVIEGQ